MMTLALIATQAAAAAPTGPGEGISPGALAFMLLTMTAVTLLAVWCFYQVLSTKDHFDPDGTGPAQSPVAGREDPDGI